MQHAVILAGGSGTRLWPLSRANRPKQLLPVVGGRSLLQVSYDRLRGVLSDEQIYVCCASSHLPAVRENLPDLPLANLIGEPTGRDTANAIGLVAEVLMKRDRDAVCAVVTADHVIEPQATFHESLRAAFEAVAAHPKSLVTLGITPTHGHTGLGYIQRGEPLPAGASPRAAYKVLGFKEKPDRATADRYVDSGRYYWNSGMFIWRCEQILEELKRYLPEARTGLARIGAAWGTAGAEAVLGEVYPTLPKISIDFAVMEKAAQSGQVLVVELPVQWTDIGSWPALSDTLKSDDHDNAVDAEMCVMVDSDSNIVVSSDPSHLVTTMGISDMIVVHTRDVTMVCAKSEAQRVKELVERVRGRYGERFQ